MLSQQRTRVSREGAYYALVVIFILGGAALRQVDLLVVFAGLLLGPALIHWRLVGLTLQRLIVRRRLPAFAYAGRPSPVSLVVENDRLRLPSWAITFEDKITGPDDNQGTGAVLIPFVGVGKSTQRAYLIDAPRRGRYTLGPATLSTQFPLGLFRSSITFTTQDELLVLPKLGTMGKKWVELFDAPRAGEEATAGRRHGNDGEFFALREWRSGDSRRWIHWRSTARLNYPVVRQLEHPQSREAGILLDLWASESPTPEEKGWIEVAISFAATSIHSLAEAHNRRLQVLICGKETQRWTGDASRSLAHAILGKLATIEPGSGHGFNERVAEVAGRLKADAPIVVLSTRPPNEANLAPALARRVVWLDMKAPLRSEYFTLDEGESAADQSVDSEVLEDKPLATADVAISSG